VVVRNAAEWQRASNLLISFFWECHRKALGGVEGNEAGVSNRYKQRQRFLLDTESWSYMVREHLVYIFRKDEYNRTGGPCDMTC
jgi:hypothetical protein